MADRVLFISRDEGSFIDQDISILSRYFFLHRYPITKASLLNFPAWIRQIFRHQMLFVWFGSFYCWPLMLVAKLLRKKILLVAGGFDVAKAPEIQHGAFTKSGPSRLLRRSIFSLADRVLAVSESNRIEAQKNAKVPAQKISVIPLGFEAAPIPLKRWQDRSRQVVMISSVPDHYVKTKGWDQFLDLVKSSPTIRFVHIGQLSKNLRDAALAQNIRNLELKGYLPFRGPEFLEIVSSSRVVVQMSYYESFGAAVIDAALLGCLPLVSAQFALPELIQVYGRILPYGDRVAWQQAVEEAVSSEQDPEAIAQHFLSRYHLRHREEKLVKAVKSLMMDESV